MKAGSTVKSDADGCVDMMAYEHNGTRSRHYTESSPFVQVKARN